VIPALRALGKALRRTPIKPTSVAALLSNHQAYLAFREAVREVFPEREAEILAAQDVGASRGTARVSAFLHGVEAEFFPVYELEEYEQVAYGIPFIRNGWSLVMSLVISLYGENFKGLVALVAAIQRGVVLSGGGGHGTAPAERSAGPYHRRMLGPPQRHREPLSPGVKGAPTGNICA
jgi:hypothetical protein